MLSLAAPDADHIEPGPLDDDPTCTHCDECWENSGSDRFDSLHCTCPSADCSAVYTAFS